jgi:hypothetical protein
MSGKKPAASPTTAPSTTTSVQVHQKFHGQLIGTGGAIAKKFAADFNVRLNIPARDSSSHVITLAGSGNMQQAIAGLRQLLGFPVSSSSCFVDHHLS